MSKVFSGNHNELKEFPWMKSKDKAVNSKKSPKRPKSQTRKKENLEIKKVLSTNEEKILEAMKIEKKEIEENVKADLTKEIEKEKNNYQHFRIAFEELDKIKKDAYNKGFNQGIEKGKLNGETLGYQKGLEKAEQEYKEKLLIFQKSLASSLENIQLFKEKILNNAKSDTLELAIMMTKKIIAREVSLNPKVLISIIENSLQNIIAKDKLNIFLNKDDYEIIKNEKFTFANAEKMVLTADSQLKRGEIRIESDLEQLNYSINENINKLGDELKNEFL